MEAIAIIPFVIGTLKVVDRTVGFFGRLQNTPKEIRMLRILLAQINEDLDTLKPYIGPGGLIRDISTDEQDEIKDALGRCGNFLTKYCDDVQAENIFGRVYWTAAHGRELKELKVQIERINPVIIDRLYFRLILSRINAGISIPSTGPPVPALLAAQVGALPPAVPRLLLDGGDAGIDTSVPREHIQEAEERLRERQSILDLRLQDILDTGAVATDADFRNLCGSTLSLQSDEIPLEYRTLKLEELQVAARDKETTVLHFCCNEGAIRIKHLVPFATLPRISDISSSEVSFGATHAITLMCRDGHHLFHIKDPRYCFTDVLMRRKFQELVRGRELVAEFEASEVTALATTVSAWGRARLRDRILAMGEPLQVWRLDRPGGLVPTIMTMTFLATMPGVAGGFDHLELHFDDRVGDVQRVEAEGSRRRKRKAVQGRWVIPDQRSDGVRITFQTEEEAERFAKLVELLGPNTSCTSGTQVLGPPSLASRTPPTLPPINIEPLGGFSVLIDGT